MALVPTQILEFLMFDIGFDNKTRSSWLNCALRDDEAVYWVSLGHSEASAVGSVEGIYAFIYCTKWRSEQVSRMSDRLTDNFER